MSYHVETTTRFDKEFKKLDKYTQQMIKSWIGKNLQNCENPRTHGKGLIAYKMSRASPTPLVKNERKTEHSDYSERSVFNSSSCNACNFLFVMCIALKALLSSYFSISMIRSCPRFSSSSRTFAGFLNFSKRIIAAITYGLKEASL